MSNISISPSMAAIRAIDLRRRTILKRIKAPGPTTDLIVSLAFPANPDRDDRHPSASQFLSQSTGICP